MNTLPTATFLIGLPRCGSLALSRIMDNENCAAHHEGGDYGVTQYERFEDSYSFQMLTMALIHGKNYFNCDISCGMRILKLAFESRGFMSLVMAERVNLIYVNSCPERAYNSMLKLLGLQESKSLMMHLERGSAKMLASATRCKEGKLLNFLTINKNKSDRFTPSQLTEIAYHCGSLKAEVGQKAVSNLSLYKRMLLLAERYHSMTQEQVMAGALEMSGEKDDIKVSIPKLSSN